MKHFALVLLFFLMPVVAAHAAVNVSQVGPSTLYSGLVGWWTLDGKNLLQNVTDSSGQGNNGRLLGITSTSSVTVQGKIGQALSFDASTDYVEIRKPGVTIPALAFGTG